MPQFQQIAISYTPDGGTLTNETYADAFANDNVFTYRKFDAAQPLFALARCTVSLKQPTGRSNYHTAQVNVNSPIVSTDAEGKVSVDHSNYAEISIKVHKNSTQAEAEVHLLRTLALLQNADITAVLTKLESLR